MIQQENSQKEAKEQGTCGTCFFDRLNFSDRMESWSIIQARTKKQYLSTVGNCAQRLFHPTWTAFLVQLEPYDGRYSLISSHGSYSFQTINSPGTSSFSSLWQSFPNPNSLQLSRGKPLAWNVTDPDTYAVSHLQPTALEAGRAARQSMQQRRNAPNTRNLKRQTILPHCHRNCRQKG